MKLQSSFIAGEIDPLLAGRIDIRAASEGCRTLRNVIVNPSGGVRRRPGTRIVCELAGSGRLIGIELVTGTAIAALSPGRVQVVEGGRVTASLAAPWTASQVRQVRWTRRAETLLLTHANVEPQQLSFEGGSWRLVPLAFAAPPGTGSSLLSRLPFHRFAKPDASLQAVYGSQSPADPIGQGLTIELRCSQPVFTAEHYGVKLRIRGRQVTITSVTQADRAIARTDEALLDGQATYDWQEEAFSAARGWPVAAALHQDRLVLGGTRDLRNRLWFSRTGAHLDFHPGTGLDDEAISFALTAEGRHEVTALVPSRQLQALTTTGEWVVKGSPLSPSNVQVELQTMIGSSSQSPVRPLSVDGATLFIGGTGRELREFLYTDSEQAYQAADLALLCRHLLPDALDMTFDAARRLLCILRSDGRLATVTLDRTSNVAAWTLQETVGRFTACLALDGQLIASVELGTRVQLVSFEDGLHLDNAIDLTSATPTTGWTGLAALNGQNVALMSAGAVVGDATVKSGGLTTSQLLQTLRIGTRFTHVVEALPLAVAGSGGMALDQLYRVVKLTLRVHGTPIIEVDAGNGVRSLTNSHSGLADIAVASLGWRRPLGGAPWRIDQDEPSAFNLLATTLELKVNT